MIPAIIAFAIGAILGALAFVRISFWCLVAPIAILAGLTLLAVREARGKEVSTADA